MGENAIIDQIPLSDELAKHFRLDMLREDLAHLFEDFEAGEMSGNKWRKLKYNIQYAKKQGFSRILTFGGAFSNHIAATAAAGEAYGVATIGVIRGEPFEQLNPTLQKAVDRGMQLVYMDREKYRMKDRLSQRLWLENTYGPAYIIPEGGSNQLGVKGCEEMMQGFAAEYDYFICSVGTGATLAGIINAMSPEQHAIGVSALKGAFNISENIQEWLTEPGKSWEINHDYHFGGYAKVNPDLIEFINSFKKQHKIQLDPVYTGKMVYASLDLLLKKHIPEGSKVLMIHTGGQQGIDGMNMNFKRTGMQTIEV